MAEGLLIQARPALDDLTDLQDLWADPQVSVTLGGVRSAEESRRTNEIWCDAWRNLKLGPWIYRFEGSHAFVGYSGLLSLRSDDLVEAQLLYAVRPEQWGRGLGTLMGRSALADGRSRFPHLRIVAFALPTNIASRRVLEKLDFRVIDQIERAGLPHLLYELNG